MDLGSSSFKVNVLQISLIFVVWDATKFKLLRELNGHSDTVIDHKINIFPLHILLFTKRVPLLSLVLSDQRYFRGVSECFRGEKFCEN